MVSGRQRGREAVGSVPSRPVVRRVHGGSRGDGRSVSVCFCDENCLRCRGEHERLRPLLADDIGRLGTMVRRLGGWAVVEVERRGALAASVDPCVTPSQVWFAGLHKNTRLRPYARGQTTRTNHDLCFSLLRCIWHWTTSCCLSPCSAEKIMASTLTEPAFDPQHTRNLFPLAIGLPQ